MINFKKWSRVELGAPIFVWLGAENFLEQEINSAGFFKDHAPHFNDLLLYVEHSVGISRLNYAIVCLHIKKTLNAHNSPKLDYRGSYGGVIVARFCRKYPHIAHGALASSAPILCFDGIVPQHGYYYVVT
ncbi:Prolyl carboxy peptidase like protein [Arachis hypogaea]|nr:Prolyl carboxy peptidase like protein [Arachis hypogaea]